MIQINATTHTDLDGDNGLTIATGSVLEVKPKFHSRRKVDDQGAYAGVQHDIEFEVDIYKNMASYESMKSVLVRSFMKEYDINFTAYDVDIQTITSVTDLQNILKDHIENGGDGYPGVGAGNCEIVWPSQP